LVTVVGNSKFCSTRIACESHGQWQHQWEVLDGISHQMSVVFAKY